MIFDFVDVNLNFLGIKKGLFDFVRDLVMKVFGVDVIELLNSVCCFVEFVLFGFFKNVDL